MSISGALQRDGFVGPMPLFAPDEALALAQRCYAHLGVDAGDPGASSASLYAWHHHQRWVYELAADPRILAVVEQVLGPDIVCWAMACWYKEPRSGQRVPWHQDTQYWPMHPTTTASIWIALTPTTRVNGCLRVVPGSHHSRWSHGDLGTEATSWFPQGALAVDDTGAVDLVMAPGEVVVFDEGILHGSDANTSPLPRLGISFRYSPPTVRFDIERWSDPGRIRTFLVRGEDRSHHQPALRGTPPPRLTDVPPQETCA